MPVHALPAGRPHGDAQPQGPGQLRAELLGRGRPARGSARSASSPIPAEEQGAKIRARSETFADHYSQARQFYISQTEIEQTHIANALTFELSKVETPAIRARMVSHLLNIDEGLAQAVAKGLAAEGDAEGGAAGPADPRGPEALARAEHPQERPEELRRPQGRGSGHRRRRRRRSWRRCEALKAEGAMLKLVAPEVGGVDRQRPLTLAEPAAERDELLGPAVAVERDAALLRCHSGRVEKASPPPPPSR